MLRTIVLALLVATASATHYKTHVVKHVKQVHHAPVGKPDWVPAIATCPPGFKLVDGTCIKASETNPLKYCTQGTLKWDKCVSEERTPASRFCPEPYILEGDLCITKEVINASDRCPPGFTDHYGQCIKKSSFPVKYECPSGFILKGTNCVRVWKEPAAKVCPYGFTLRCPHGDDSCKCVRRDTAAPSLKCPNGFTLSHDKCFLTKEEQARPRCEPGFKLANGVCEKVIAKPAAPICTRGGELVGDICKERITAPVERRCPSGFEFDLHGECIKIIREAPVVFCPPTYRLDSRREICIKITEEAPLYTCTEGDLKGRTCVIVIVSPPNYVCPAGYDLVGDSVCVKQIVKDAAKVCPYGYTLSNDGYVCKKREVAPSRFQCAAGKLKGDVCLFKEDLDAKPFCPRGELVPSQNVCEKIKTVDAEQYCPPGYTFWDGQCKRLLKEAARLTCSDGSKAVGDYCIWITETAPEEKCPSGFTFDYGKCVKVVTHPAILVCPKGYKLVNGQCEGFIYTKKTHYVHGHGHRLR